MNISETELAQIIVEEYGKLLAEDRELNEALPAIAAAVGPMVVRAIQNPKVQEFLIQQLLEPLLDRLMAKLSGTEPGAEIALSDLEDETGAASIMGGSLEEKAESEAQYNFMQAVKTCKEGGKCGSEEIRKAAKSMTSKQVGDYTGKKPKGLPKKKEKK